MPKYRRLVEEAMCIHTMEYYAAIERNNEELYALIGGNFYDILLWKKQSIKEFI